MSINHILTTTPDEELLDVKFGNVFCDNITTENGGSTSKISQLSTAYTGSFVYDAVYEEVVSQISHVRRVNENFYISFVLDVNRLGTYNGGATYIYILIPTAVKNILATEYPPIVSNQIRTDIYGVLEPNGNNTAGICSIATPGYIKINEPGYVGTHLKVEFKDYNTSNPIRGRVGGRFCLRFNPTSI